MKQINLSGVLVPERNSLISIEVEKLLNFRIAKEEESSWMYLAMSMWLNNKGWFGAAKLYKKYSEEEKGHADWARDYLLTMGITPITPALPQQKNSYTSLSEILSMTYTHENEITKQCKDLCAMTMKEGDFLAFQLGQQYLKEQLEEIDKARNNWDRYLIAENENNLIIFDQELGNLA